MSHYSQEKVISEDEYYDALYRMQNIPSKITGKKRQNLRQKLKKQIKEYEYNIKYTGFTPLPYITYHVNRTTPESILQQLIQASTASIEFTLDTESMKVYKAQNRPSLIQIQVLLRHDLSLVIIFEMMHLPPRYSTKFSLIEQLFAIIFSHEKLLYIWGTTEELLPFTSFNLFTCTQISSIRSINLQDEFKSFWQAQHPHRDRTNETPDLAAIECICEQCIGKQRSESWSLQDAVARSLNEYLSKILTEEEEQYRQALTTYALYDCLAIQRIIIFLKNNNFQLEQAAAPFIESIFNFYSPTNPNDDDDDDGDDIFTFEEQNTLPKRSQIKLSNENTRTTEPRAPLIPFVEENHEQTIEDQINTQNLEHEVPLIDLNRYPAKRESKLYTTEAAPGNKVFDIIKMKLYLTSSIEDLQYHKIKTILKRNNIPINNVKPVRDRRQKTTTLNVAVREPNNIPEYEIITRNYFTSQHHEELQQRGELPRRHRNHHYRQ
ncbi:unnamed protein product [Adineta ricciae]|uniref:Uncharacterized protein n=1 Tax=Adineta ricciae TaxID=249248 RepID=A0A816AJL5_ADIRI|nr:unnamed protein product [Adineta ricciae]CAF1597712.1 unnamed protein product [Adineta ricciae]